MNETAAPAQPAPITPVSTTPEAPAAPETQTAAHSALEKGDVSAFRLAKQAERRGQPLPDTAKAAPAPDPAAPPPRPVSKRQERINNYERDIAELKQQVERLSGRAPQPPAPAAPTRAELFAHQAKQIASLPDAPKIGEYESIEEHAAAMALFVQDRLRDDTARASSEHAERTHYEQQHAQFVERFRAAAEADPELPSLLPPALLDAVPLSGLPKGAPSTFANVAAEALLLSDHPGALARHLATHPHDVERIGALPKGQWLSALTRLDGRLSSTAAVPPASPPASPLQPPPVLKVPATLGSKPAAPADPLAAALARGDVSGYRAERQKERLAARVR